MEDINRPDRRDPPKMAKIAALAESVVGLTPQCMVVVDDNLMSSVCVSGSFDEEEKWVNGIWENSRYFRFFINPRKGARYYKQGEKVTIELACKWTLHKEHPFRKSTTTPEKAIQRIVAWVEKVKGAQS